MCVRSGCTSEALLETLPTETALTNVQFETRKDVAYYYFFLRVDVQGVSYRANTSGRLI